MVFDSEEEEHRPGTVQREDRNRFITVNFTNGYADQTNLARENGSFDTNQTQNQL